jgi:hypothetical protein
MSRLKAKPPAEVKAGKTKAVIFGASGVGKTWFALSFPAPYYLDTEGGASRSHYMERLTKSGGAYMGVEDGTLEFSSVIGQIQALATEKHPYKTLIIDSVTKIFQMAIAQEQERLGDKDVFGASKKPAVAGMRRLVNWVSRLDMNVIFIAHEATEWGEVNGQRQEVGKIPDIWDKLVYELDLSIRVVRQGKNILPPTGIVHKSRLTGFAHGDRFPLEYGEFASRYGKDAIEADATTITLASPEQVAEIVRMVELLKIPTEQTDKILTRAAANEWKDMSDKQAADTIEWLTKKINGKE